MGFLLLNHVEPEVAGKRREPCWVVEVPPGAAELPASLNLGQPDKVALSRSLESARRQRRRPYSPQMAPTLTTSKAKPLHHNSDRACP